MHSQPAPFETFITVGDEVTLLNSYRLVQGANITLTADSGAKTITIAATGGGGVTQEQVDDHLATAFIAGIGIEITYNDPSNTFRFDRLELLHADADAATINVDWDKDVGEHHEITILGDRQIEFVNPTVGEKVRIKLTYGVDGATAIWPEGVTFVRGIDPKQLAIAGRSDLFQFLCKNVGGYGNTYLAWVESDDHPIILEDTVGPDDSEVTIDPDTDGTTAWQAMWHFNEVSGTRAEHAGVLDLAVNMGTPDGVAGLVGNCCEFAVNEQLYGSTELDWAISSGDVTWAGWVRINSSATSEGTLFVVNTDGGGTNLIHALQLNASNQFRWGVLRGASSGHVDATTFGSVPSNTWVFVACRWTASSKLLEISVNRGSVDSTTASGTYTDNTATGIQVYYNLPSGIGVTALRFDECVLTYRVLSDGALDTLYNSGSGTATPPTNSGSAEVQTLTVAGSVGTYDVEFRGDSVTLNVTDNAAAIQTGLRTLTALGGVVVTGSNPYTITFPAGMGDVELLTVDDSGVESGITIDWTYYDGARLTLAPGSGTYTVNHINPIPGKTLIIVLTSNDATGDLSAVDNVDFGTPGEPELPADGETLELEFHCDTSERIVARKWFA